MSITQDKFPKTLSTWNSVACLSLEIAILGGLNILQAIEVFIFMTNTPQLYTRTDKLSYRLTEVQESKSVPHVAYHLF